MSTWQQGDVVVNGVKLHYTRTGGDKPPLVLAHGITDNGLCWTRLARVLARYHDVIMVDARGHGQSDKPESGYTQDAFADDLAGLVQALRLERPVLMGHSMGGGTVTRFAAKYPDLTSGIILEDPAWNRQGGPNDSADYRQQRAAEWRQRTLGHRTMSDAELLAAGRMEHPTWSLEEFEWWGPAKRQVSEAVFEYVAAPRNDWTESVKAFAVPALLLYGDAELGGIITPEVAAYARQLNPLVIPRHIAGAGHNVRRERFEDTVAAIQEFMVVVRQAALAVA